MAMASAAVPLLSPVPAMAQAAQDDQIPTSNGNLTIHPVHHAGVVLTWNGKRIVADPTSFPPGDKSGAADFKGANPPDLILITHEHGDHFSVPTLTELVGPNTVIVAPQSVYGMMPAALQAKTKVMKNGEKGTYAGVPIEAVVEYNTTAERQMYHPKGTRQWLCPDNGRQADLPRRRYRRSTGTEEPAEHRRGLRSDESSVHDDGGCGGAMGKGLQAEDRLPVPLRRKRREQVQDAGRKRKRSPPAQVVLKDF
jgi:hypothetical protein